MLSGLAQPGGPGEGAAAEHVGMDLRHGLACLRADVAERPDPLGGQDPGRGHRLGGDSTEQAFRHTKILDLSEIFSCGRLICGGRGAGIGRLRAGIIARHVDNRLA